MIVSIVSQGSKQTSCVINNVEPVEIRRRDISERKNTGVVRGVGQKNSTLMYLGKSLQSHADVQTRYHGYRMILDNYVDLFLDSSHNR